MKKSDLKKKTTVELQKHAQKLRTQIAESHRAPYVQEVRNVKAIKNLRRELARTLTLANQSPATEGEKE
jgi:ribosomal protein L29